MSTVTVEQVFNARESILNQTCSIMSFESMKAQNDFMIGQSSVKVTRNRARKNEYFMKMMIIETERSDWGKVYELR